MCGIVGYAGERPAREIVLDALARLEIRGYDSSGIVLHDGERLARARTLGGVARLESRAPRADARLAIGHTRWATHGRVEVRNAHPLWGCERGVVAVALNGIVENFAVLRAELEQQGHRFRSDTDAEVVSHLVEGAYRGDLTAAVQEAVKRIEGHFAFVVIHRDDPEKLVGARRGVPLIAGTAAHGSFLASSLAAFNGQAESAFPLTDGDVAVIRRAGLVILDASGAQVERASIELVDDAGSERGDWESFMLKEIHEQPRAIAAALAGRLDAAMPLRELEGAPLKGVRRVLVLGCGTSYNAGLCGVRMFERWAGLPASAEIASEWRYAEPIVEPRTLVVAISQSGETADTLAALRLARARGAWTIAVTNTPGSEITRAADATLLLRAGGEIGVAATKTFATQVVMLALLALRLAVARRSLPDGEVERIVQDLAVLPARAGALLSRPNAIEAIAEEHADSRFFLYLGRDLGYPTCLEGALKLRELAYVPTEAYPAGELKHGPIALVDDDTPVVCVATDGLAYDKLLSGVSEVRARGGRVIAIATDGNDEIRELVESVVYVPRTDPLLQPVLATIPLQLLAYHVARSLELDVDRPRNLAKTVTVE